MWFRFAVEFPVEIMRISKSNTGAITGTLEYDPEFRFTQNGKPVLTFRLLTGIHAEAWESLAEEMADDLNLREGAIIEAQGVWRERKWTSHQDGKEHTQRVFSIKSYKLEAVF